MQLPIATSLGLITTLVVVIAVLYYHARARSGRARELRALPAIDVVRGAMGRAAETGRAIHVSPGAGIVGGRVGTAETIAGLLAAERVTSDAALKGAGLIGSAGDAVAYLALRGQLRQAYVRAGLAQDYNPVHVQLLAHQDAFAYATGVAGIYERQRIEASQLVGLFGQELLLFGAEGQQRQVPQLTGTTTPVGATLAVLSSDGPLLGEEIYAVDAYLAEEPEPRGRLMTHDFLRTVVIVLVLGGLLYSAVQPFSGGALPALPQL
jgi:hypothetical protein